MSKVTDSLIQGRNIGQKGGIQKVSWDDRGCWPTYQNTRPIVWVTWKAWQRSWLPEEDVGRWGRLRHWQAAQGLLISQIGELAPKEANLASKKIGNLSNQYIIRSNNERTSDQNTHIHNQSINQSIWSIYIEYIFFNHPKHCSLKNSTSSVYSNSWM